MLYLYFLVKTTIFVFNGFTIRPFTMHHFLTVSGGFCIIPKSTSQKMTVTNIRMSTVHPMALEPVMEFML